MQPVVMERVVMERDAIDDIDLLDEVDATGDDAASWPPPGLVEVTEPGSDLAGGPPFKIIRATIASRSRGPRSQR